MSRTRWHILREGATVTVTRRLPVRYDVGLTSVLRRCDRPLRLAQQVRQDLWRAVRDLRGFAPAVTVRMTEAGAEITAGGRVEGPLPRAQVEAAIREMLDDRARQARWLARCGATR